LGQWHVPVPKIRLSLDSEQHLGLSSDDGDDDHKDVDDDTNTQASRRDASGDNNFAAKRLSLSTQVTRKTQYTSYVPFYGAAPWKQQHLLPTALVPMHQYRLNTPQYMPPTEL
jgi:hypothetical protein